MLVILASRMTFTVHIQLAQPIRLLLAYTEIEYEDVKYESGGRMFTVIIDYLLYWILAAPDYDRSAWFSVKETLGLAFPNVSKLFDIP